jgi:alpha-galactosidase
MQDGRKSAKNKAGISPLGFGGVCLTLILFALILFSLSARTTGYAGQSDQAGGQEWVVGNQMVQAVFRLSPTGTFDLAGLRQPGGREWTGGGRSPIWIKTDALTISSATQWRLVDSYTEAASKSGQRQVIVLQEMGGKAQVKLSLETHPNQPFIHILYTYKNLDTKTRSVQEAHFFNLRLNTERQQVRTFYLNQMRRGQPLMFDVFEKTLSQEPDRMVTVNAGAYADNITWLALRDEADHGLVFGWEFNGRSWVKAQLSPAWDLVDVWGSPADMHINVAAGSELAIPGGFVGLYQGDWDEAAYRTHQYVENVLVARAPDNNYPYLMFDTWGYGTNIDEKTLQRAADIAASIGVEVFIVDLGWARRIGDWEADPAKFPGGLEAFADYVRAKGMKLGLHFVPVEAEPDASVLRDHPDWTSSENNYYFDAVSLCIGNTPTQTWLRTAAQAVVDRYHPDWLTQDGENLVKTCTKKSHSHIWDNSNWANSENGIDSFIKFMRSRYPKVHWENNGDGGTMSTFEAVKYYIGFASCDACWYTERRQAIYGMSYVFPPRFITRYMLEQPPTRFLTRSSMFGGPWILMQRLTEWSQADIDLARQEAQIYKSLRSLIRTGKVYHLLNRPDGINIDAMESFDAASNRGVIFVYRPESPLSSQTIYPRGLNPNKNYRVTFQESKQVITDSGANLMARGIPVSLPDVNFAEIVYITGF